MKQGVHESYDFIVIGSGFGGSVSALRLSEKGYKVLVLEQGRRFSPEQFPRSDWNLRKFLWLPSLGFHGIMKCSFFKPVFILSGAGVGGGSLVYAATLLEPPGEFFANEGWPKDRNWEDELGACFAKARHMLGATKYSDYKKEDELLLEVAEDMGMKDSFAGVDTGIYLGDHETETDPYFNGEGPLRKGCTACAGCMTGCRENAKNTLDKNYLYFAEKKGATILAQHKAWKIEKTPEGYSVYAKNMRLPGKTRIFSSGGIVVSAAVLGTLDLLLKQRDIYKTLPLLSPTLGTNVRTNSESLSGLVNSKFKLNNGPAITSIFSPEPGTYIEPVKFNDHSGAITHLSGFAVSGRTPLLRAFNSITCTLRHPLKALKIFFNFRWGDRSVVLLVMQSLNSSMQMKIKKGIRGNHLAFAKESGTIPSYIPVGQEVLNRYAEKAGSTPMNCITEILLNKATTAHIIGGCPMGSEAGDGVVDSSFKVHNYPNMYILDSTIIPCNLGVNPSLTITALAEYAMGQIPENNLPGQ